MYETMKEAGYKIVAKVGPSLYLKHKDNPDIVEHWMCNKNHASYGLKYKNTHLEFCASFPDPYPENK